MVIDCQKKAGKEWKNLLDSTLKECNYIDKNASLLFILSPNDLVYLPTEDEIRTNIFNINKDRIYKIVSFTGNRLYAIPYTISKSIVDKAEYTQLNKVEFTDYKESIKEICLSIKVDRLGNIIEFNGMKKE
jgi:CRISPR-associated endonuclease Csn1